MIADDQTSPAAETESRSREALERLLASGHDNAVLRFSLGNAYLSADGRRAIEHLERAIEFNPAYSAAWKLLAKALVNAGENDQARATYVRGIAVAEANGDLQAAKEMRVFLRRLTTKL
ncbi:MAG: tetratricopeptide repeat protein [Gammaproteobacteria bacterium]